MAEFQSISMKVYSAIAKSLIDHGVETLFGLIGDGNLYIVDSFVREFRGDYVSAANEAGATLMALGYATASGKVGVATVTHGPALTNTLTALVEGVRAQASIVLLCGDTAVEDKNHFQNIPQRELIVATGAGFEQLRSPKTVAQDVATALRRAIVERRPIALNMPYEFQSLDTDYRPVRYKLPENRAVVPSSADLDNAVGIIAAAKRPVIVAGRGATSPEAKAAILRLAELTDALLATTLKAKGLFKDEAFGIGVMGTVSTSLAVDLILKADCIIGFGASLNEYTTSHGAFLKGKRIVQINLEQGEVGRYIDPDAGVVGDPALTADVIAHWLEEAEVPKSGFRNDEIKQQLLSYSAAADIKDQSTDTTIDVEKALLKLNDLVPANRYVVTDGGRFLASAWKLIEPPDGRSFMHTVNFGSIGLGMSHAVGVAKAHPERPILIICGDGGFMLGGLMEFNTAVRHSLDIIVVVCNDNSYGAEHVQFRMNNMDPKLSALGWPDFAPIADVLGGKGVTVRNETDLAAAGDAIRNRKGPILIDVKTDPDRVPGFR